jgi:hypothetical protein
MAQFDSFAAFYPVYISEHANRTSRRLHVIGTALALCCLLCGLLFDRRLLWAVPFLGYGFAWLGHYAFERNRPATFRHPMYSLLGDFRLFYEVTSGRRRF